MKNIKIPIATIFEMDDVGWDNGKPGESNIVFSED